MGILEEIVVNKRQEIEAAKNALSLAALKEEAASYKPARRPFAAAISPR